MFSKAGIGVRGREIAVMLNVIMIYVVLISVGVVNYTTSRRVNGVLIGVGVAKSLLANSCCMLSWSMWF